MSISAGSETYFVDDQTFKYATTSIKVVSVVISLIILLVSHYAFIFFVASMLPTIVAIAVDRNAHKCASATICSFNLIGALPYIVQLWQSVAINSSAKYIIADVSTWLVVYGASIVGVLMYVAIPLLIGRIVVMRTQMRIKHLCSKVDAISNAWGVLSTHQESQQLEVSAEAEAEIAKSSLDPLGFAEMVQR